ncbi:MAG: hypothetical protein QCI82_08045 [Candidatus Thermoplasmatota archaeon]|nr:hypothetical protein [Candidatus Thermoplasmatota archaeon]
MRLLCLNPAFCMRAYRQLKALHERGFRIDLRYLGFGGSLKGMDLGFLDSKERIYGSAGRLSHFKRTLFPSTYRRYILDLLKSGEYDLILVHNMPDILGAAAVEYSDIPVVLDERDMVTAFQKDLVLENYLPPALRNRTLARSLGLRTVYKRLFDIERAALERSDGRTWVSDHTYALARSKHEIPEKNNLILYNYASRDDMATPLEKLSESDGQPHVVYEGVLSSTGYRAPLKKVFMGIAKERVHIHVYGIGPPEVISEYKSLAERSDHLHFHEGIPHHELMRELTRYDWGIVPFDPPERERDHFDTMLPNKFFDYLVCGLPVLAPMSISMKHFIEKEGTGAVYRSMKDIPEIVRGKRPTIERDRFVMENHIQGLIDLFKGISKA